MNDISQKVLENIDTNQITPKSRWRFIWQNGLLWLLFFAAVLLGSLAFAVVLYYLLDFDTETYAFLLRHNTWFVFLSDLPYIWLIVTLLFLGMAYYYFHHTKKGYKYGFYKISLASLLLSLLGGALIYAWSDVPEYVDNLANTNLPFYRQVMITREQRWMRPQFGLLGGIIQKLEPESMELKDLRGVVWQVDISDSVRPTFLREQISVRVVGDKLDENHFKAQVIRLWNPRRGKEEQGYPRQTRLLLPIKNI